MQPSTAVTPKTRKPYTITLPIATMLRLDRHAAARRRHLKDVVADVLKKFADELPPEDRLDEPAEKVLQPPA